MGKKENAMGRIRGDRWLSREEAAEYLTQLGCPTTFRTLEKMAVRNNEGHGPPFIRPGWKTVRYLQSDLEAWAKERMVKVK
jgi:predicted DNA-binding transcriptional regulator AlpA